MKTTATLGLLRLWPKRVVNRIGLLLTDTENTGVICGTERALGKVEDTDMTVVLVLATFSAFLVIDYFHSKHVHH